MRSLNKLLIVLSAGAIITGCAAGKAFMAGYEPPQTIADLLREQYGLAGEIPPELDPDNKSNDAIGLNNYADLKATSKSAETQQNGSDVTGYQPLLPPVQRFSPFFTYKSVQDYAGQLAMDLVKNGRGLNTNLMIGVSSFVKLDRTLQNTTILGNQLAEYSISEMQQFGLTVIDHKLMPAIQVTSRGDLAFSRDVIQLANKRVMDHVLSGTMIEKADGVFVNARIISLQTNQVVSSASVLIPRFVSEQTSPRLVSYSD
ncbi:FlgO family outer membrane protein [Glaciecola petra]|uniref:FlgO family outer membrane protein n=1 Tax=Glaciecola petra TaxID=3075602 RepID=A0ABU2ZMV8_9ALTE|nr:FlgO family outer membrane protein [Aestuariibacter sp. P117]MDT0593956.1 FlgO family outer membrane protein [Aestuariibacter sp. P117]